MVSMYPVIQDVVMKHYNYAEFSSKTYDLDNFHGPRVGEKAQDFIVLNTENIKVNLLDFIGEFLVLELGSITCPLFQGRRAGMRDLVSQFPSVSFSVLYIREAHPGFNIPSHQSINDKILRAKQLQSDDEKRNIFVDDIKGTAHNAYGGYPNSMFIINKEGCVVFRSDWNNVSATKAALIRLLSGRPANIKSYFLPAKPSITIKTLKQSGQGAMQEFFLGLPMLIWKNFIKRNILLLFKRKK